MISPRATQEWQKWKYRLDHPVDSDPGSLHQDVMQDTVGAVAWDNEGNLAAGVSRYARHASNSRRITNGT
jgi:taspase (threonine aspartase 1)